MILNDGTDVPYALIPNLNNLDMYCIPVNEGDVFRI